MGDKYNLKCGLPWDCDTHERLSANWKSLGHVLGEKKLKHSLLGNGDPLWALRWGSEKMKTRIF